MAGSLARLLDAILPVDCAGCGAPAALVCERCAHRLSGPARVVWPSPTPPGLPTPWAVTPYAGESRELILAAKERGMVGVRRTLCAALTVSASTAVAAAAPAGPVLVVAMPSARRAVRERGEDLMLLMARSVARSLRRDGCDARQVPALRHGRRVADSAGLSAAARLANLDGAIVVRSGLRPGLAGMDVLVVDDVITTGASMAQAARALRDCHARVIGGAAIAATLRTSGRAFGRTPRLG